MRIIHKCFQQGKQDLTAYERFVVLGGKNYLNTMRKIFGPEKIGTLLSGCSGIGYMVKRPNDAISKGAQFHDKQPVEVFLSHESAGT